MPNGEFNCIIDNIFNIKEQSIPIAIFVGKSEFFLAHFLAFSPIFECVQKFSSNFLLFLNVCRMTQPTFKKNIFCYKKE